MHGLKLKLLHLCFQQPLL